MELTALVEAVDHVCCRYRLAAFGELLAAAGHVLHLQILPRNWVARLRLFRSLRGASVVLQRRLLPIWQISYLRYCVRHLLFDFDDALFLRDSYSRNGLNDARRLRRFAVTVRACDAIIAGNDYLRSRTSAIVPGSNVLVIPTCVDSLRYSPRKLEQGRGEVQLVWIGSSSTLQGLDRCAPLLEAVGEQVPGARLKLICDRSIALKNLAVDYRPWSEQGEAAELASADIGISWIPDDDWSRGKCGLKVLQYMAAGLPVVANPVGVQAEMVQRGETGFLASSAAEWVAAIGELAANPGLRRRMGEAGRQLVADRYDVAVAAEQWLQVIDNLGSRSRKTA
jgi:glycosyltransferase involved in cell wall biosynthesis